MADKKLPTSFRLPDDLRQKLPEIARRQSRSVNNLVVYVLRQYVDATERDNPKP